MLALNFLQIIGQRVQEHVPEGLVALIDEHVLALLDGQGQVVGFLGHRIGKH